MSLKSLFRSGRGTTEVKPDWKAQVSWAHGVFTQMVEEAERQGRSLVYKKGDLAMTVEGAHRIWWFTDGVKRKVSLDVLLVARLTDEIYDFVREVESGAVTYE